MAHTVTVSYSGKPPSYAKSFPITFSLASDATVGTVKQSIAATYPKFSPSRQKITLKNDRKPLSNETLLSQAGLSSPAELSVKDLGPQVSWTTVFIVEYAGPLFIHPLFYYFSKAIYGQEVQHSELQKYVFAMVLLHFAKRELETIFVHRFSHETMPLINIFKNSSHYHLLSGVLLAADIYRPAFSLTSNYITGTIRENPRFLSICVGIWAWAQLSNLVTHVIFRSLRPAGSTKRAIPYGYGFSFPFNISCPNYFFESVAWGVIAGMTGSYAAIVFFSVSTAQMGVWAIKKHANYKKQFGKEYPRRKAMIPFLF